MSTAGFELKTASNDRRIRLLADIVELVSSMRFAITMLVMISIASIMGTVVTQGQPLPNYVNQFGPFWFEVFNKLGLYAVYSAWWFILILSLLIASTSFCIIRNGPRMIRDMRSWRENVRENSLRNFHHKTEWSAPLSVGELATQCTQRLAHAGYATRIVEKDKGLLVAAKKGAANKFGYIFAHSAIIIILVGGMLDSDLPIQFQEHFMGRVAFTGEQASPGPTNYLSPSNPTFRGSTSITEGDGNDYAVIARPDGLLVQPLPFTIHLKKFEIDFYTTGAPKLFASQVEIRDPANGVVLPATIKVNEPLIYRGVAIYQSDFSDGGSKLKVTAFPMQGSASAGVAMDGQVKAASPYQHAGDTYSIEWTDFRSFNVENTSSSNDPRAVTQGTALSEQFAKTLDKHSGSAAKDVNNKDLKNVGPSVEYKVRDKTGQAREFKNYMQPVVIDGVEVFLTGVRSNPNDQFSYLRIPADEAHSVKEWMRLRAALGDEALRQQAAARYARRSMAQASESNVMQLQDSARKTLDIFAGDGKQGGYLAVSKFLEKIEAKEQEKAAMIVMKILNGTMWELWQAAREKDGLPAAAGTESEARFLQVATNALSDNFFYGAPVYFQLNDFVQLRASVLQVSRAPGKPVVYLGCLFLILGVFAMFYIRERRLWVWVREDDDGTGAHALMAMSTQRKTLDFEHEFNDLKAKLPQTA